MERPSRYGKDKGLQSERVLADETSTEVSPQTDEHAGLESREGSADLDAETDSNRLRGASSHEQSPLSAEGRLSGNDEGSGQEDYAHAYSEEALWKKIAAFAGKAGKQVIEKVLTLYYCLRDSDTPARARATIAAALGYFIFPMDAIPDMIPGAGFSDDLGALAVALAVVAAHIKDEHKERAKEVLKTWFG